MSPDVAANRGDKTASPTNQVKTQKDVATTAKAKGKIGLTCAGNVGFTFCVYLILP